MHHFAIAVCAGIVATAVVGATALTPTPAGAAKTPSAEAVALKEATTACKAEAKEKKISWPSSRKFVSNCVAKTVKLTEAQLQEIAVKQAIVACKAEAKGKKIRWPTSRRFVSTCLSNALKDYHLDVALLRRELDMAGLRRYTPQETGCMQNVYCED
jgi:preprotein translocase subunit SecE